jgi:hypothetical protein
MTKNLPGANVATRSSTRNAAVAKDKVAETQQGHQAKPSDAAAQATDQAVSSDSRGRAPRNKPDASKQPAKRALTTGAATNSTPRPTVEVESGAVPVSGAAKGAKTDPRGNEEGDSRLVASNGLGIDDGSPVPDQRLDADDQARSEDRVPEHISKTGAPKGTKRSSQDAENDNSPPGTGKRARKSTGRPLPTGDIGAPGKAPSEDPGNEPPPPEPSRGHKFGDILLQAVVVNRALRERVEQHKKCCRLLGDAQSGTEMVRIRANPRVNRRGSNAEREIDRIWKLGGDKTRADGKTKYMDHRLDLCVDQLQNFPHVSRDDDGLEFLADNDQFWGCFDQFQERLETRDNLDIEIERAKQELVVHDNATERLYRRIFEFGDRPSIPAIVEANVFGDLDNLPGVMRRLEQLENSKSGLEREQPLKPLARRFLFIAEDVFVQSRVLVNGDILCNWHDSEQWELHGQGDSPQGGHLTDWTSASDGMSRFWQNGLPGRGGGEAPDRYAPGRYALDSRTPRRRYDGHVTDDSHTPGSGYVPAHAPDGYYFDRHGRVRKHKMGEQNSSAQEDQLAIEQRRDRYRRHLRGQEDRAGDEDPRQRNSAPAEPSVRKLGERFDLAKRNLQHARAEFEGARDLIESEIRELPPPITEDAIGVAAAQKLIRRTRALTGALQEYKATYERARKAGLTEGGEKTANFTDREDDGYTEGEWAEIKATGKARVPEDWDGKYIIPQVATPTRQELDISLMVLLSPRLGEDAHHVAAASSRYRKAIDALLTEGHNLREASSFPKAQADEPVVDGRVADGPVPDSPVVEKPVPEGYVAERPVAERPVGEKPVADGPAGDVPVAEGHLADEPVDE